MPAVASPARPWLLPGVSLLYAAAFALALLSADQLAEYMPGAWFDSLASAVLALALLTVSTVSSIGWRRYREGLRGHALAALGAVTGATLIGLLAVFGMIENANVSAVISGADVHLTRPLIESLPRPPGTRLLDETPGLQGTESISQDISAKDLKSVVPFYELELARRGWVEDKTSATTPIVRFTKDDFVLSVGIDPPSSGYTITVDRITVTPSATSSPSPAASTPSPAGTG